MPLASVNGTALYYEEYGEGPAILGIHGTPSSVRLWVDAAQELARLGRSIVYDRRGFGRSARPDPSSTLDLEDHVEDARKLLAALDAHAAIVIGRSTGGLVGLALAHRYPDAVRGLVLLEPAVFSVDPDAQSWAEALRSRILEAADAGPAMASQAMFAAAFGPEMWAALPSDLQRMFADAGSAVLAEIRGRGLDLSQTPWRIGDDEFAALAIPTLLVSSEDSPAVFSTVNDRLAALMPHAVQVRVSGGHLISPSHPVVLDYVRRLFSTGG